jgi:hypothetical protein
MSAALRTLHVAELESSGHCIWCNRELSLASETSGSAYCSDTCRVEAIRKLLRRERFKAMRHETVRRREERMRLEAEAALLRSLAGGYEESSSVPMPSLRVA